MSRSRKLVVGVGVLIVLSAVIRVVNAEVPVQEASFDELFRRMRRYGNTAQRRKSKADASAEFKRREGDSLAYLLDRAHIRSIAVSVGIEQLVRGLDEEVVVPVLVSRLSAPNRDTRKMAAYHLGEFKRPEHAKALEPLLGVPYTAGSAIRTLGKWEVREAVPRIVPFLEDADERRRIAAVIALGAIGDARAVPHLLNALSDAAVTVRKSAARSLTGLGDEAERALLEELATADERQQREMIRILGEMKSERAVRVLRELLDLDRWQVRSEAARALVNIRPESAPDWIRKSAAAGLVNADGTLQSSALPHLP